MNDDTTESYKISQHTHRGWKSVIVDADKVTASDGVYNFYRDGVLIRSTPIEKAFWVANIDRPRKFDESEGESDD